MTYDSFALGLFIGFVGALAITQLRRPRKQANRTVPQSVRRHRTLEESANAMAFAQLYQNYGDRTFPHFLTDKDREEVWKTVRGFVSDQRDRLGEVYLGPEPFEGGEEAITTAAVTKAIDLFLQV